MSLQILSPSSLLLVPLVAGAFYLFYISRTPPKEVKVPTLLFFAKLPQKTPAAHRRRINLRFLFDLLLALILIIILSGVTLDSKLRSVAVVIDTSPSMNGTFQGRSFLTEAVAEAKKVVKDQEGVTNFTLYTTESKNPIVEGSSAPEVLTAISALSVGREAEALGTQLAELQSTRPFDQIFVFTDRVSEEKLKSSSNITIRTFPDAAAKLSNIAILSARYIAEPSIGRRAVEAEVASYSEVATNATFALMTESNQGIGEALDVKLSGSGSRKLTFPIPEGIVISQAKVRLASTGDKEYLDTRVDDNELAVTLSLPAICVDAESSLEELGLSRIPAFNIIKLEASSSDSHRCDAIISYKRPLSLVASSSPRLIVLPQLDSQSSNFGYLPGAVSGEISRSEGAHPLLKHLQLSTLSFPSVRGFKGEQANGFSSVLSIQEHPVLLASEGTGQRAALFGFDLFPYVGKENLASSLLLLNSLQWIARGENAAPVTNVQESNYLDRRISIEARNLDGNLISVTGVKRETLPSLLIPLVMTALAFFVLDFVYLFSKSFKRLGVGR